MAKVSTDFERLLNDGFLRSLETAVSESGVTERWEVRHLSDGSAIKSREAYVLTLSSHLFRIITVLHFNLDKNTEAYIAQALGAQSANLDQAKCYDYLAEVGNSFCGCFKRELQKAVAALGMSTPNLLNEACVKYVKVLKLDGQGHASARLADNPLFFASYYLSAYGDLNYTYSYQAASSEAEVGELEFF